MINSLLNILGFPYGRIFVNSLPLNDVFFIETEEENEVTDYAIDGNRNTDLTLYVKRVPITFQIRGFLQNSDIQKFEELRNMLINKTMITFNGTSFDDRDFVMISIKKVNEGYNYLEYEFTVRELILAEITEFTTESKNIPTTRTNTSNTATTSSSNSIPVVSY